MEKFAIINRIEGRVTRDKMYFQMGEEGNAPDAYEMHVTRFMTRLVYRDFTISDRYPNNIVLVNDMGVCVVQNIKYEEKSDAFFLTVSPFKHQTDFYTGYPCNSTDFSIYSRTPLINTPRGY